MNQSILKLINLIKEDAMQLSSISYDYMDIEMKDALKQWVDENFNGIPLPELGLDTCVEAFFFNDIKAYVFSLGYDGSATGTDPCGGTLLFSDENKQIKLLLNTVECGS